MRRDVTLAVVGVRASFNVGVGLNTVQGWYSDGDNTRKLPTWEKVDILRYRTGLASPRPSP